MSTLAELATKQEQAITPWEAWEMVRAQLRHEMSRAQFETWVEPLKPIDYENEKFTVAAVNPYARDWVESRLKGRISRMLEGYYQTAPVKMRFVIANDHYQPVVAAENQMPLTTASDDAGEAGDEKPARGKQSSSKRKVMLQRAYGSERARIIQPERGMFITNYFFQHWLGLIGHSAMTVILAARSMCYWNPLTGELRNEIETEMSELAERAAVSVRTVKSVLNDELVHKYFLRYSIRRVMTPNGVRTAGIMLQVRMDDPLTPEDQEVSGIMEDELWVTIED
ncbi:MAG: hypothetical protein JEZ00_17320 [Anaerolineaceae bacterium]|nr:hypothetical protein [Anaerolineaceae bacterium]